jgi:hypothetical protein
MGAREPGHRLEAPGAGFVSANSGGHDMAETETPGAPPAQESGGGGERIPVMQRILDNPFLLLFLGITLPAALYVIWGIMEIVQIPVAK